MEKKEERLSELKGESIKLIHSMKEREKKIEKKINRPPDTCGRIAKDLSYVLLKIQKERENINTEKIFEDMVSLNFLNLVKGIHFQIQESQSMNPQKNKLK